MHYLIDGHNLIGQMPDIHLDDPDDEVKLVLRLRRWAARGRKRRLIVVFDRGLPGGRDKGLSTGNVKVIFASSSQQADTVLMGRIEQVRNPGDYTLVSSDRRIRQVAEARRMPIWSSQEFAARMMVDLAESSSGAGQTAVTPVDDPQLSADELAMWLDLFEGQDAPPKSQRGKRKRRP